VPEYLAPGVYVEETSFRSKSIEGVSTSTTGFAGPTRKGPIGNTPSLLTSLGDFERIYGGLEGLQLPKGLNHVAHAARAYFDNGGSRLYVSRVFAGDADAAKASSQNLASSNDDGKQIFVKARFPGSGLDGTLTLRLVTTSATRTILEKAPDGTLVRTGVKNPAKKAVLEAGLAPFYVPSGGKLVLTVVEGGNPAADFTITFNGTSAEAPATDALVLDAGGDVDVPDASKNLVVTVDGVKQTIAIGVGKFKPDALAAKINIALGGGYCRLDAGKLVVGSDKRGSSSKISVEINNALGFKSVVTTANAAGPGQNLPNLNAVSAENVDALLTQAGAPVRAALSATTRRMMLTSNASGKNTTITVKADAASVHEALGLTAAQAASGENGDPTQYFVKQNNAYAGLSLGTLKPSEAPKGGAEILTIFAGAEDADGNVFVYEDLAFAREHPRWIGNILGPNPSRRADALENPYFVEIGNLLTANEVREQLFGSLEERAIPIGNGSDGSEPRQLDYEAALREFEALEDVSIVAAPGGSAYDDRDGITGAVISHAEKRKMYRIAVLDTPPDMDPGGAREFRSRFDSKYAALYHPWVVISNPLFGPGAEDQKSELTVPPSGFVCGIYARNDIERTVSKAPANEVVRGALRFEDDINFAEQELLNPLGVNCLRFFAGRGYRVWGARTASSDPEWKYVNVRRYFNYLEASIDRGTQWAVFESNGERLWANITETISQFLLNEWVSGNLLGATPQEAFFVRCDRSTMTQNDLDNGRLICLIGVAALKPAEFVIFRIGQKTIEARS
jgi:phage tail sheath protein FI